VDLGRVVLRREAAADRPGRPDRREGRPSVATALGQGLADAMLPHGTVWSGQLAWSRDYAAWSVRSLVSEWTGLGGPTELGGQDGARPQRGQPGSERDRLDASNAVTCENGVGATGFEPVTSSVSANHRGTAVLTAIRAGHLRP
jgi:hypothetical protein